MDWNNLIADRNMILSKHYTSGRSDSIRGIVLHHNAGNLTIEDCYNVWQSREASAHYQVQDDGLIGQLVNDWDTAWHAGNANSWTIGIEHANNNFGPWTISDAALESGAHLVASLCRYYGLGRPTWMGNVFPHSHFMATACPGEIAGSQNAAYMNRAQEWYDAMANGTDAGSAPTGTSSGSSEPSSGGSSSGSQSSGVPVIMLQARTTDGTVLPATSYPDFAGWKANGPIQFLSAWCSDSAWRIDVQAYTAADGWLPWLVNPSNINDLDNGAVGNNGPILGLKMYLYSPNADYAVHYQVNCGNGYYPEQTDTDVKVGMDGYAGDLSNPIYEVKAYIGGL